MYPFILLISLLTAPAGQPPRYELVTGVKTKGEQFYSDPLGNVYVVNAGEIKRFNNEYREVAHYSDTYLGKISGVDLSDPLRILLFYKDYNQIVWLDNYLAELRSPILLDQLGYQHVGAVCSSSQGGFWLYNNITCQIHYFDRNMNMVHESISIRPLLGSSAQPSGMMEKNRKVYLNVPDKGIFLFDIFGNFVKTIPLTGCTRFQVTDKDIFFYKNDSLFRYNIDRDMSVSMPLPGTYHPVYAEIQPEYLYIFTREAFYVYRSHRE
jgi:hypothetical protein